MRARQRLFQRNQRYTYDPYGAVTIRDASWQPITWDSSTKNIILYTGHKFDTETGFYYSLYRYYHPGLGRWATRDPQVETKENLALRGNSENSLPEQYVEGYTGSYANDPNSEKKDMNLYWFVGNNSILYIDMDGRSRVRWPLPPSLLPLLPRPGPPPPPTTPPDMDFPPIMRPPGSIVPCPPPPNDVYKCSPCPRGAVVGRTQNRRYRNERNGCGPFDFRHHIVGDRIRGLPRCILIGACDFHDCCQGWCGRTKQTCDEGFRNRLIRVCLGCTARRSLARRICMTWVLEYYYWVRDERDSYEKAQREACQPCCCASGNR